MEFKEQYLTYEQYRAIGGTLDLMPFNLLEFESRKQIDLRTQNRLKNIDKKDIPVEVKLCEFHLISKVKMYADSTESANNGVMNESTDGYSVTYSTPDRIREIIESKKKEIDDIIMTDLYGVVVNGEHIIFNGVK